MLRNYLKIAVRNLLRHKGYTFINVFGLAVGIACAVLILAFVRNELGYDRFNEDADLVYRVAVTGYVTDTPPDEFAVSSRPMAPAIRQEYPDVEAITRMDLWNPSVKHNGKYFYDDDFIAAEPDFFKVFTFPLLEGDPETALRDPYTLVLTQEMAKKYFGDEDPLGKTLTLNDTLTYTVTGVAANVPKHSHFQWDFLTSWITQENQQPISADEWLSLNNFTYLKLKAGADATAFGEKVKGLIMQHFGEQLSSSGIRADVFLEPLLGIYLHSKRAAQIGPTGDISYVYVFSAIAAFVLLIACINFMNLATARSMERAKEVGLRKVVGSSRGALIRQFLSESILIALLGLIISIGLDAAALPFFNQISGKEIGYHALFSPGNLLLTLGLAIVVGLLAGSYPAFALSGFRPVEVLKGSFKTSAHGALLRQGLVVFQFAISVALIVGTLIVMQQLHYMKSQDLGFDKSQVLVVEADGLPRDELVRTYETVKQEFEQFPGVKEVSASNQIPGRGTWVNIVWGEGLPDGETRRTQVVAADHDYVKTMGIHLVAGRDFSEQHGTDATQAVLVNESAVKTFGWKSPQEALGKWVSFGDPEERLTVVGVINDYHHFSLKQKVEPMILRIIPQAFQYFSARVDTKDVQAVIGHFQHVWDTRYPGYAFQHFFLNDDFNRQYQAEDRLSTIFAAFATIAILIACLGLFGLASFITAQRTKEIGVRKVLGASVSGIVLLLSKDFVRLVLVALVVSSPLAYFAMHRWLKDFPYHIDIGPAVFVLAGVAALLIALLTVSYQSIRAAVADPVKSLRYE